MHWVWPFKACVGDDRDEEINCSFTGDAQPDFLCVGAQKGGTSWLYQQLASHPDFWMPPIKELHYFDKLSRTKAAPPRPRDERDLCFLERIKGLSAKSHIALENYARLFEPKGSLLSGDISPTYSMLNDEIIERVVSYFPNLKVIFLARDPVDRAWSQLSMGVRLGMISPFDVTDSGEVLRNLSGEAKRTTQSRSQQRRQEEKASTDRQSALPCSSVFQGRTESMRGGTARASQRMAGAIWLFLALFLRRAGRQS